MLFFVVLSIWFALSIPATLVIGRMLGAATDDRRLPSPERRSARAGTASYATSQR